MDLFKFQDDTILAEWMLSEVEQDEHADLHLYWNVRITHPEGHTDRIKMDWCDTRGPVLI